MVTHRKGAYFSVVSLTLTTRERDHSAPRFWGSFYLCIHPLSQNYQIRRGNTSGRSVSWGQPRLSSQLREQSSSAPQILGVLLYLCVHPLTQNYQIRHGNQYAEGRVLGQPRHCVCTNESRGLSAIAEFVVVFVVFSGVGRKFHYICMRVNLSKI